MTSHKVSLYKAHDFCQSKNPKLVAIFIHGIASNSAAYNDTIKYLEGVDSLKDVRFITFDLLGNGNSPKSDEFNYDYKDQLEALHNSIIKLNLDIPLVLIGHSLGTFIVTKYADTYKNTIEKLILISPPVYTPKDFDNPAFILGIESFKKAVSLKNHKILEEKSFNNSMEKIVLNKANYQTLTHLKTPATLIYDSNDQLIGAFNIPGTIKENSKYLSAIKTTGGHSITNDKYIKVQKILEETLNAQNI